MHGRHRNLVVMATGTGKTVVAALDYRRLRERRGRLAALRRPPRGDPRAEPVDVPPHHARRLVRRALRRRRAADGVASRLRVGAVARSARPGRELDPDQLRHGDRRRVPPRRAPRPRPTADCSTTSQPKVLLGLTATPERADGAGRPCAGSTAGSPSSCGCGRRWNEAARAVPVLRAARRRRPAQCSAGSGARATTPRELTNVYTGHDARSRIILQSAAGQGHRRRPDAGARLLREHRPRRVHGGALQRGRHSVAAVTSRTPPGGPRDRASRRCGADDVNVRVHRRPVQRGRRRPGDRHGAVPASDRERDRLPPAARPRPPARRRQAVPHRARLHRQPARRSSASTSATGPSPGSAGEGLAARDRARLPDAAAGLPHRARPGRSRPRAPQRAVVAADRLERPGRRAASARRLHRSATFLDETGLELDDIYRRRRGGWAGLRRSGWTRSATARSRGRKLAGAIGRMLHIDDLERLDVPCGRCSSLDARPRPPATFGGRAARLLAMLALLAVGLDRAARPARRRPPTALGEPIPTRRAARVGCTSSGTASGGSPVRSTPRRASRSMSTPATASRSCSPPSACQPFARRVVPA